jgi:hypothetical protein
VSNFAQSSPKFKRATRVGSRTPSWRSRSHGDAPRPNENATYRERLDNADTSVAYDADGRRAKEDAATEETINKDGSSPRRKSENNAEFPAKTAGSPEGLITAHDLR